MNSTANLSELEKLDDGKELRPAERARLASLILRLGYGDDDVLPDLVDEQFRRLDRKMKFNGLAVRRQREAHCQEVAPTAAALYLRGGITMAEVAQRFGISERSLSRAIAKLSAREVTNHE